MIVFGKSHTPRRGEYLNGETMKSESYQTLKCREYRRKRSEQFDHMEAAFGCPLIIPGSIVKMTRKGFKRACLGIQKNRSTGRVDFGVWGDNNNVCLRCEIGKKIKDGKQFKPPRWVSFYSLSELKRGARK